MNSQNNINKNIKAAKGRLFNEEIYNKFNQVGIKIPHILLPNEKVEMSKFACIAADQFSYDKKYWDDVKNYVGNDASAFKMMFPEAYMPIKHEDIDSINNTMSDYINSKVLNDIGEGFIYVKRWTSTGIRQGLMLALDLNEYDYGKNSKSLIRPTEGTVEDRLPIRVEIRENASLDMPHVMVLINDKKNNLMNYLNSTIIGAKAKYSFDLMMDGGHIEGYQINNEAVINEIANIFLDLKKEMKDNLMFAIGDGNHSLAAAKICYEKDKIDKKRYALVEVVNIYDDSLEFYPIHRLLMNVDKKDFIEKTGIDINDNNLDLQLVQKKIDEYIKTNKNVVIEYMHDKNECIKLGEAENNLSIIFDDFNKDGFFDNIVKYGTLCRKTFSMGHAKDKRYYLETMSLE